jgi:2-hydroxychromene-2-carboxylate isomerase
MKPENLNAIVHTVVGSEEEAKKVVDRTKSEEVKKRLSENTDRSFKEGAFGLPWFVGKFRSCSCQGDVTNWDQRRTRKVRRRNTGALII